MSRTAYLLRPSNFQVFKLILKRHLLLSIRNINDLIHPLFYFVVATVLFRIAIGSHHIPTEVGLGIILVTNIFALMLTYESLVAKDYSLGFLEQFYLIGCDFSIIILAKYLGHFIIYAGISLALIPLVLFLMNVEAEHWLKICIAQILLNADVLLLLLFSSSMLLGSKSKALLSIVVLIFILPSLIFATLGYANIGYLGLLLALILFLGPIIILASKYLVLIALEDRN